MYVILSRNGYEFAADGMDYVIVHNGEVVFRNMNKTLVEKKFMELSR